MEETIELKVVKIEKPDDVNFILGQSHFIKSVEDIAEAVIGSVPIQPGGRHLAPGRQIHAVDGPGGHQLVEPRPGLVDVASDSADDGSVTQ
jgi:hypothetical protein